MLSVFSSLSYSSKCTRLPPYPQLSIDLRVDGSNAASRLLMGLAIHEHVQRRFSSKLKDLLDTLFKEGEWTKDKCTAEHAMTFPYLKTTKHEH